MTLNVLLFGPLADAAGARAIAVDVAEGSDVACVLGQLHAAYPRLRSLLGASRLAVNSAFAALNTPVQASDELALIGMVSGG